LLSRGVAVCAAAARLRIASASFRRVARDILRLGAAGVPELALAGGGCAGAKFARAWRARVISNRGARRPSHRGARW
jgi:hypothetical protein